MTNETKAKIMDKDKLEKLGNLFPLPTPTNEEIAAVMSGFGRDLGNLKDGLKERWEEVR